MGLQKQAFSQGIIHTISELCSLVFNVKTKEQLYKLFGITPQQMQLVVEKLANTLPETMVQYPELADEIKTICAREFIFFQVQERWDDPHYQANLKNFIQVFSRDMQHKIETYKNQQAKEER